MAKRKAVRPQLRWEDFVRKGLRERGTSLEAVKRDAFNKTGIEEERP